MADRQQSAMTLLADLPATGLSGTVTLTDALGNSASASTAFTEVAQRRYRVTITPTPTRTVEGDWTATWSHDGSGSPLTQRFTVGPDRGGTLWDARLMVARRIKQIYIGTVDDVTSDTIVDAELIGGSTDHHGAWLLPWYDEYDAGRSRRVVNFDGTTLHLARPAVVTPSVGDRFVLFPESLQPTLVDAAINQVIHGLTEQGFVRVRVTDLVPDTDGIVSLPNGWTHVYGVAITDPDDIRAEVEPENWEFLHGRKLIVEGIDETYTVHLRGLRPPRVPQWDDSVLDINPEIVVPGSAAIVHQDLAGGSATDYDAHLQRANNSFQQFGVQLTINLPNIPMNARRILD
jgi:hypothetical protein